MLCSLCILLALPGSEQAVNSKCSKQGKLEAISPAPRTPQLFSIAGNLLFAVGLWWIQKSFLHVSWRAMIAITIVGMNLIDMPFTFCTIFDVVRNRA